MKGKLRKKIKREEAKAMVVLKNQSVPGARAQLQLLCAHCHGGSATFNSFEAMKNHVAHRHFNVNPKLSCQHCGCTFGSTIDLQNHLLPTGEKQRCVGMEVLIILPPAPEDDDDDDGEEDDDDAAAEVVA